MFAWEKNDLWVDLVTELGLYLDQEHNLHEYRELVDKQQQPLEQQFPLAVHY